MEVVCVLRYSLPMVFAACLAVAPPLWAADDGPRVIQTMTMPVAPNGLAVAPGGGRIAITTPSRLRVYALKSDGTIDAGHVLFSKNIAGIDVQSRLAFTPNGKRLYLAAKDGVVHFFDCETWTGNTINLDLANMWPWGIYALENPPLLLLSYNLTPDIFVVNHAAPKSSNVERIKPTGGSGFSYGGEVTARADGLRLYGRMGTPTSPAQYVVHSAARTAGQPGWVYDLPGQPFGLCLGPDVNHVLAITAEDPKLYILDANVKQPPVLGCNLDGPSPSEVALTNDGYYAVIADIGGASVTVVSGHDLRGRLDPALNLSASKVRRAVLAMGSRVEHVALHPTRPLAYVTCLDTKQVKVVKLAIPGIEHP